MPLQETIDTYNYFLSEADKLGLSYIVLVRYSALMDVEYDGKFLVQIIRFLYSKTASPPGKLRATQHDVLETYRSQIKNSKVFLNAGVTPEEARELMDSGKIDGAFIGFAWITHPDLVKRVQHEKPLDNSPDFAHLQWGKDDSNFSVGYTDYSEAAY